MGRVGQGVIAGISEARACERPAANAADLGHEARNVSKVRFPEDADTRVCKGFGETRE